MDTELNSSNESEYSTECVVIDQFACDLNLVVDKECLLAYPLSTEGFCSMWAGCRANFGVKDSKTAFEVHASITFDFYRPHKKKRKDEPKRSSDFLKI